MISRNDPCWCGSNKKWKKCHYPQLPSGEALAQSYLSQYNIVLKTAEQIAGIRKACQVTAEILAILCDHAKEGVTTLELDTLSRKLHAERNAIPACLGYDDPPFPMSICTSLNEVICHGIPEERKLEEGDFLNIDVSSIVDGYFGDCSRMVAIGLLSEEKQRVMRTSYECLMGAIALCKPGTPIRAIGDTIEEIAALHGCSVVNQFVGHGVGLAFHEAPEVPHHYNNIEILMAPGMTFTIEPMINAGKREAVVDPHDKWTVRTIDGRASAQWEHTLLITDSSHEILTKFN